MNDEERLEAWLDGRLSPESTPAFLEGVDRGSAAGVGLRLQGEVDEALRRGFRPPPGLGARLAERVAPAAPPGPRPALGRTLRRLLVCVAAALVLAAPLLFLLRGAGGGARVAPVGPPVSAEAGPARVHEPDLRNLYRDVSGRTLTGEACPSIEPPRSDLQRALAARYGSGLDLHPDAETLLDGPFVSPEWPSGTVLAGLPDGPGGPPSVLIAEHESEARCCLRLAPPADGTLSVFTWQVGDVFLTEVTPRAQPALLPLFYEP